MPCTNACLDYYCYVRTQIWISNVMYERRYGYMNVENQYCVHFSDTVSLINYSHTIYYGVMNDNFSKVHTIIQLMFIFTCIYSCYVIFIQGRHSIKIVL